jgi:two-component system chemotaxis response regulator CheB
MNTPIRLLLVDDSALVRRALREMFVSEPEIIVVGEAADGREALEQVKALRPDLVILDVRMPVMDGVETTRWIMAYQPTPILVLTAALSSYDVDITLQMLDAGALDVVEKPEIAQPAKLAAARHELVRKVRLLARVPVVTHLRGRRQPAQAIPDLPDKQATAPVPLGDRSALPALPDMLVVIGASTGGPRVVRRILNDLPASFGAAVLVVQHMSQGFGAGMADWLNSTAPLPVRLACEAMPLEPGVVLVAPDKHDLLIQADRTVHLSALPVLLQRPAIDIVMQSAAEVYGSRTIGVLLTGMGRDGAIGLQSIHRAGGYTIAQDAASCTIYGMPRAAVELGVVDRVLLPEQIAAFLCAHVPPLRGAVVQ